MLNPDLRPRCTRSVDCAGLQTGDASLNIDAGVVVMTTEILRNMLYRVGEDDSSADERLQASSSCSAAQAGWLAHKRGGGARRGGPAAAARNSKRQTLTSLPRPAVPTRMPPSSFALLLRHRTWGWWCWTRCTIWETLGEAACGRR